MGPYLLEREAPVLEVVYDMHSSLKQLPGALAELPHHNFGPCMHHKATWSLWDYGHCRRDTVLVAIYIYVIQLHMNVHMHTYIPMINARSMTSTWQVALFHLSSKSAFRRGTPRAVSPLILSPVVTRVSPCAPATATLNAAHVRDIPKQLTRYLHPGDVTSIFSKLRWRHLHRSYDQYCW